MPTYKQWHQTTPESISYVVDYFLDKQQDIRADHDWDAEIIHKWAVSTINRPLGVITLDPDYAEGTLYGYQQLGYETNTESDYPPKLLELVKDGAGFIDYCDKKDIITEIQEMVGYSSMRDVNGLIRKTYLDYRKAESSKEEGIEGAWG